MIKGARLFLTVLSVLMFLPVFTEAKEVGLVVQLKGDATIQRKSSSLKVSLKDDIKVEDKAMTADRSRLKILFDDDSLLTLGENSMVVVKEYYYSNDKQKGKSVFQLVDGKLKSLVRGTDLEIHTPTAVIAARGTYFKVWMETVDGSPVTNIIVFEGFVEVFNVDPVITGMVTFEPGTMGKVFKNSAPSSPVPAPVDIPGDRMQEIPEGDDGVAPLILPIEGQQPVGNTPVRIRVKIP